MPEAQFTLTLGGQPFPIADLTYKKKVRVDDPAKAGKKKSEEVDKTIMAPDLSTSTAVLSFITALVNGADQLEPGNGLALAKSLVFERVEDANDVAYNKDTGDFDEKAYGNFLLSPERPRSAGSSIRMLEQELSEYTLELVPMVPLANSPDGWSTLVDKAGKPVFASQGAFLLRLNEICNKLKQINQQIAARHESAAAKKSAAAAKAEAAAKAAAAAPAQA